LFGSVVGGTGTETIHQHNVDTWWAIASAIALACLFASFAWQDATPWFRSRSQHLAHPDDVRLEVAGMTCNRCVNKLEKTLTADNEIESAVVTLHPGEVVVRGKASAERVGELVSQAGFVPRLP
jgi:copper chaperone CopZ